ncbi:MAG: hypothetical protein JWL69_4978, partial [Phycisphaerales bacterium]|nr:hypothetical protein [Phycisphaerales bacterium]
MTSSPNPSRRQMIRSLVGGSILFPALLSDLLASESRGATA